jgi:hypothetical protein
MEKTLAANTSKITQLENDLVAAQAENGKLKIDIAKLTYDILQRTVLETFFYFFYFFIFIFFDYIIKYRTQDIANVAAIRKIKSSKQKIADGA